MDPPDRRRCWWPGGLEGVDALMLADHDTEWGVPVSDDRDYDLLRSVSIAFLGRRVRRET
jgi:3-methyladenine DNA glycosylase Tag